MILGIFSTYVGSVRAERIYTQFFVPSVYPSRAGRVNSTCEDNIIFRQSISISSHELRVPTMHVRTYHTEVSTCSNACHFQGETFQLLR